MKPDTFPSQLPIHLSNCPCGHAARATHAGTTRGSLLATTGGLGLLGNGADGDHLVAGLRRGTRIASQAASARRQTDLHVPETGTNSANKLAQLGWHSVRRRHPGRRSPHSHGIGAIEGPVRLPARVPSPRHGAPARGIVGTSERPASGRCAAVLRGRRWRRGLDDQRQLRRRDWARMSSSSCGTSPARSTTGTKALWPGCCTSIRTVSPPRRSSTKTSLLTA